MKPLLLIPVLALPLLMTGCETVVVDDRRPRHSAYVERDVVVDRHHHRPSYYDRDVVVDRGPYRPYEDRNVIVTNPRPRRTDVVVVNPKPAYRPQVQVRYYNDTRGRYYVKDGRRIYTNAGVHY